MPSPSSSSTSTNINTKRKHQPLLRDIQRKSVVKDVFNIASSEEKEKIQNFMHYGVRENPYLRSFPNSELSRNSENDAPSIEPMVVTFKLSEHEENNRMVELRIQMDYSTK